ncbi:hypothetical protein M426DRAFT_187340 [Hypoxylon sp. CI-4A]|nr:hypothetical protein M426DRAFT_187340 [Hypoxylon sp. CI-4A]
MSTKGKSYDKLQRSFFSLSGSSLVFITVFLRVFSFPALFFLHLAQKNDDNDDDNLIQLILTHPILPTTPIRLLHVFHSPYLIQPVRHQATNA